MQILQNLQNCVRYTCASFHVLQFQCLFKELRCCSSSLRRSVYHLNLRITKLKSNLKRTTYFIILTLFTIPFNILLRYKCVYFITLEQ